MITEEELVRAYNMAVATPPGTEASWEAWHEYWGMAEQRRTELAVMRGEHHPMTVVPRFEDPLQRLIDEFDREEREQAERTRDLLFVLTDGE